MMLIDIETTLRQLRQAKAWSQAELSRRSGVHPSTICAAETRGYRLGPRQVKKVARALGVTSATLLGPPRGTTAAANPVPPRGPRHLGGPMSGSRAALRDKRRLPKQSNEPASTTTRDARPRHEFLIRDSAISPQIAGRPGRDGAGL